MKKVLLLASTGLLSVVAFAQNGFYFSPSIGAGISKVNPDIQTAQGISQSGLMSYQGTLGIGYQLKRWRIQSGIQYLTSGYQLNNILSGSGFDPLNPNQSGHDKYRMSYTHIGIPIQIGYTIAPHKKWSLVPYLGIIMGYNTRAAAGTITSSMVTSPLTKAEFDNRYNRLSIWGTAALHAEYKVIDRVSLFGGPSFKYMLSNFGKPFSAVPEDRWKQRNQSITLDLGIKIKL